MLVCSWFRKVMFMVNNPPSKNPPISLIMHRAMCSLYSSYSFRMDDTNHEVHETSVAWDQILWQVGVDNIQSLIIHSSSSTTHGAHAFLIFRHDLLHIPLFLHPILYQIIYSIRNGSVHLLFVENCFWTSPIRCKNCNTGILISIHVH